MSEHDDKAEEHVEDLDVPESESEDVKGGLLPADGLSAHKIGDKFHKHHKIELGQKFNPGGGRFGGGSF